ncbi:hypothetical protein BD311DRAFT_771252 [Dichomitus squalens]|uniref:Uncharacterized protein n=1 Tax=Dichomitus squalens TaxID=114155 RepID=A0A4Q9M4W3_9APHY|nr:hypothetical protein BD311DRAFT_771252 [Dichomitus squalens]
MRLEEELGRLWSARVDRRDRAFLRNSRMSWRRAREATIGEGSRRWWTCFCVSTNSAALTTMMEGAGKLNARWADYDRL